MIDCNSSQKTPAKTAFSFGVFLGK
jgi:hypothetical protein